MNEPVKVEATEKKEKKEKKVMTPERLEQLARARKKALEIRVAGASIKAEQQEMAEAALEEKLERERQLNEAVKKSLLKNEINNDGIQTVPLYRNSVVPNITRQQQYADEEEEEEEEAPVIVKKKTKKPIKTKIVIEQSSDDEDEFHTNEHVIFVKRKSKNDSIKKVVPASTPVPPNTPEPPLYKSQQAQPNFNSFADMYSNGGFINRRQYY